MFVRNCRIKYERFECQYFNDNFNIFNFLERYYGQKVGNIRIIIKVLMFKFFIFNFIIFYKYVFILSFFF